MKPLIDNCLYPALYSASGNHFYGEFLSFIRGLPTSYLGELCGGGELVPGTAIKLFLIDNDTCALVTMSPNEPPNVSLLKNILQLTKELDFSLPRNPLDMFFQEALYVLYPRVLWRIDLMSSSTSKVILLRFFNHNFSQAGILWLYDHKVGKMHCVDLTSESIETLELPLKGVEAMDITSSHLFKNTLFLVLSGCDSTGLVLKMRLSNRSPSVDSHFSFKIPYKETLTSIHFVPSKKTICLVGSTLSGCLLILRLDAIIKSENPDAETLLFLKVSNTKLDIVPSSSNENIFFLKSNDSESREITILHLSCLGSNMLYDLGVLDLCDGMKSEEFCECLYDECSTIFTIRETGVYGHKLSFEKSLIIGDPSITPSSGLLIEQPESIFSTIQKSVELVGVPRKFTILSQRNIAIVITNTMMFSSTEKISSKIYAISLEHPAKVITLVDVPDCEAIDVCCTNYKTVESAHSVFQDRTAIGLQNMLLATFIILYKTSNGSGFKLLSLKESELSFECSFENSDKSDFYSIVNYGYRIFIATGNKTGFFRIGYKPASSEFFIERSFEKKICRGYTDSIKCLRNTVYLNDMYHGVHSFSVKQITYLNSNILERNKGTYTVRDYSVANGYEDYEMPVRVNIEGLRVLCEESFAFHPFGAKYVQTVDLDNSVYLSGLESQCLLGFGENINTITGLDAGKLAIKKILSNSTEPFALPVSAIGSASGGIYLLASLQDKDLSKLLYKCGIKLLESPQFPSDLQMDQAFDLEKYAALRFSSEVPEDGSFNLAEGSLIQKAVELQNNPISDRDVRVLKGLLQKCSLGFL